MQSRRNEELLFIRNCIEVWYQTVNKHLLTLYNYSHSNIVAGVLSSALQRQRGSWKREAWRKKESGRRDETGGKEEIGGRGD